MLGEVFVEAKDDRGALAFGQRVRCLPQLVSRGGVARLVRHRWVGAVAGHVRAVELRPAELRRVEVHDRPTEIGVERIWHPQVAEAPATRTNASWTRSSASSRSPVRK